ncbi:MAG: tetratricopeptide repeat protein [Phycisphaerae bacterium]|nr:tetratricopeptide repeat protein [Phycisphaerae bacterium]
MAGILLVGLLLRGLYLGEITRSPDFTSPGVDAGFHDYWARAMVTDDWMPPAAEADPQIRTRPYLRPPGYPYFLSLIYRIAGASCLAPRIVQMALGLLNCVLAFLFARRWFSRGSGLILAAFMAVYWVFIHFEGELHAPVLLISLLWGVVYLLGLWAERGSFGYILGAGVLLGLSALARPNTLILVPVVVGWGWWITCRRHNRRVFHVGLPVFAGGVMLAVAPACIRNYCVAGDFVLISSNAGINLFIGNNPHADGMVAQTIPSLGEFGTCYDYPALVKNLERKQGKRLADSEVSAYFAGEAWRFIREHPRDFLMLTGKKTLMFWGPHEISHNKEIHYERAFSAVLSRIPGNFPLLLSLSIVGVVLLRLDVKRCRGEPDKAAWAQQRWEVLVLPLLFVVAFFLSVLPFFAAARYRVPIIPFLLLFAAIGLCRISRFVAARRFRPVAASLAACVGLYLVAAVPFVDYKPRLDRWHYDRGIAFAEIGNVHSAIASLENAVRINPFCARGHNVLGTLLARSGKLDEAIRHHNQALRIDPGYAVAHNELAKALFQAERFEEAVKHYELALELNPAYVEAHDNLAAALVHQGRLDEAVQHWACALRLRPNSPQAHNNLGNVLSKSGKLDRAIEHYQTAIRLKPDYAQVHVNWANALVNLGHIDEAIEHYTEALRLDSGLAQAHNNLGRLLAWQGKTAEAVNCYESALRLRPDYATALTNLGAALVELDRLDEAIKAYRRFLALNPNDESVRRALANVLRRQGCLDEAIEQ